MTSTVVVAVVTYNSADVVEGLIKSLPPGLIGTDYQLVFADNASSDHTVKIIREMVPSASVISMGRNAGYAAGLNAAVAHASEFDAILVLNPDVRLGKGAVRTLLDCLSKDSGVGITVPRLEDGEGHLLHTIRREPSIARAFGDALLGAHRAGAWAPTGELVTDPDVYARPTNVDWAEGCAQLISAACWRLCGPWSESFFLYSEETDYNFRVRDAGLAVRYEPTAHGVHLRGESRTSPALWALLTVNRIRLYRTRHSRLASAIFWFAYLLRELTRSVMGHDTSRAAVRALLRPRSFSTTPGPEWLARAC
jgi:N-acetylglucosaminyl-diphospho-decaprenol L-rhamnosyltransferase